jgi:hypothetical protein
MKSPLSILLLLLVAQLVSAQTELTVRYRQLKDKSQTFKDYKVIKETTLDAFWKSVEDTLAKNSSALMAREQEIQKVKRNIALTESEMERREAAVEEITFDSTHITVVGIPFHKGVFISATLIVVGGLAFLFVASVVQSRVVYKLLKEKAETLLVLNSEFEEYKHRAVEKQMKLSRELQNERNALAELRTTR